LKSDLVSVAMCVVLTVGWIHQVKRSRRGTEDAILRLDMTKFGGLMGSSTSLEKFVDPRRMMYEIVMVEYADSSVGVVGGVCGEVLTVGGQTRSTNWKWHSRRCALI